MLVGSMPDFYKVVGNVMNAKGNWTEAEKASTLRRYKYHGRDFKKTNSRNPPARDGDWPTDVLGSAVDRNGYDLVNRTIYLLEKVLPTSAGTAPSGSPLPLSATLYKSKGGKQKAGSRDGAGGGSAKRPKIRSAIFDDRMDVEQILPFAMNDEARAVVRIAVIDSSSLNCTALATGTMVSSDGHILTVDHILDIQMKDTRYVALLLEFPVIRHHKKHSPAHLLLLLN